MNDVIVQFAILWGETIGQASLSPTDLEVADELKQYDSEEVLTILSSWAEEFLNSDEDDTVDFFDRKLLALFKNNKTERSLL